jgi:hypothetical protein
VTSSEISCFLETAQSGTIKAWIWDANNGDANYTGGTWPGQEMQLMGKAANGNNIYKWTYNGTLTAIPTGVIFSNDGNKITSGDGTFTNHGYYVEGATTASQTISATGDSGNTGGNTGGETPAGTLDAQYSTNPYGDGIQKTITVDGSIDDWSSNMIIAQGAANDDPRVYRPNSMYEVPSTSTPSTAATTTRTSTSCGR